MPGSTALLLTGVYLLIVAGAGFLLRQFGGSWGRALESVLVFAALLLLAMLVLSDDLPRQGSRAGREALLHVSL